MSQSATTASGPSPPSADGLLPSAAAPAVVAGVSGPLARLLSAAGRRGLRQALLVLLDQGLYSLTNFLMGVLVARACSKPQYGLYVLGYSLLSILQIVLRSLVGVPYTILSPRLPAGRRARYGGSAMVHQMAISLLAALGFALAAAVAWRSGKGDGLPAALLALSAAALGMLTRDFMRSALLARLNVRASLAAGFGVNALTLAAVAWAYWAGVLSVPLAFLIIAVGSALPALAVWMAQRDALAVDRRAILGDFRRSWNFGKWTLAAVSANTLGIRAVPWLVLLWCGRETVATLGVVIVVAGVINPAITGAAAYLQARLAHHRAAAGQAAVVRTSMGLVKFLAAASAVYVAAMVLWGDRIVGLLFTSAYRGHGAALGIAALAVALEAANVPLRALARVADRPDIEFHSSLWALLAALAASVYLIPAYGLLGAAITLAVNRLILAAVNRILIGRCIGRNTVPAA